MCIYRSGAEGRKTGVAYMYMYCVDEPLHRSMPVCSLILAHGHRCTLGNILLVHDHVHGLNSLF